MSICRSALILMLCAAALTGCGRPVREARVLTGAVIGAGVGVVGSAIVGGSMVAGAAVGAASGAVVGALAPHR